MKIYAYLRVARVAGISLAVLAVIYFGLWFYLDKKDNDGAIPASQRRETYLADADALHRAAEQRQKDLARLAILSGRQNFYKTEKEECRKIVEELSKDYPEIQSDYNEKTGKLNNIDKWIANIAETDKKKEAFLREIADRCVENAEE